MFGPLLEVEMSKKCTPLWRAGHVEVKSVKNWRVRGKLRCWNSAHTVWREANFKIKMYKTPQCRTAFGSWDVEKVRAIVAQSTFRSQHVQSTTCSRHFWTSKRRFVWQAPGILHLAKSEQNVRVLWHFQKRWEAWDICRGSAWQDGFRVAGAVQETCSSGMLGGQGADFLRGCILEHQIFRFAEIILHDRCSTSYDLASLFRCRRNILETWTGKKTIRIGTRLSALQSTFYFWRKSRRITSFLMLSTSKSEEVSQNCFVLDVATVSQNSFVFQLADREIDGQKDG